MTVAPVPEYSHPGSTDDVHVGDFVTANYRGMGRWYPGRVSDARVVNGTLQFTVQYDDGEVEAGVPAGDVRRGGHAEPAATPIILRSASEGKSGGGDLASRRSFSRPSLALTAADVPPGPPTLVPRLGDAVEANYMGAGTWYPGTVIQETVSDDGKVLLDIKYDDGDIERGVPLTDIIARGGAIPSGAATRSRFVPPWDF